MWKPSCSETILPIFLIILPVLFHFKHVRHSRFLVFKVSTLLQRALSEKVSADL